MTATDSCLVLDLAKKILKKFKPFFLLFYAQIQRFYSWIYRNIVATDMPLK